ncbi:GNAT family N-acetyltransferase [Pseudoroseomonas globiformis]|uniref:GNAT family N-acetyltransferase n=1 Tax=Teichococcus globiformis TaxID=2307229 RepID=A0ABV7G6X8_9PROT
MMHPALNGIRLARAEDLPAMIALFRHLTGDEPEPDPVRAAAAWAALLGSELVSVLVAERGGQPVSSCTLLVVPHLPRGARPFALIENVVTDPAWRRTGLGRAVLGAAMERAWDLGCYKVMLATGSHQPETLRFYEGAGFTRGKTHFEARRA